MLRSTCTFSSSFICLTLVAVLVYPAPTVSAQANTALWQRGDEFVRLESQRDAGAQPNAHPAQYTPRQLQTMLGSLQVFMRKKDTESIPVFTRQELEILGDALSKGLAQAKDNEDVTFFTLSGHDLVPGGFIRKTVINTGRVFRSAGKLNLIFGELRGEVSQKNVYGRMTDDFSVRRSARRSKAARHKWRLLIEPGIEFYDARKHSDWVLIDVLSQDARAGAVIETSTQPGPVKPHHVATPTPKPKTITEADHPIATPSSVNSVKTDVGETHHRSSPSVTPSNDIEKRLIVLEGLREKGLVTEAEYQNKRNEILDAL